MSDEISVQLHVWRQEGPDEAGKFEDYTEYAEGISTHASFLEMLDIVNARMVEDDVRPIAFDHDCREGICGACGAVVNGIPHGHRLRTTVCQLHMREFEDGSEIWVEPFRAGAFPIIRDLMVARAPLDAIIEAGGYISIRTGSASDANEMPIPKSIADRAMDAATCIGCGACVAACPNASANLFLAAKISHLSLLPQGQAERYKRTRDMVRAHDDAGFGGCTNYRECEAACPKGISTDFIAHMNRELLVAIVTGKDGKLS